MPESVDQTRRDFLKRLAKASAFVPPALVTLDVSRALGQGRQQQQTAPAQAPASTGVSPGLGANLREGSGDPTAKPSTNPWDQQGPAGPPPWSRPPPTQGGTGN